MAAPRSTAAAMAAAAAMARAAGAVSAPKPAARSREHVVRLLTFNIWFDPLCMATRMKAIGQIVEKVRPAVIGFQEVTRESLQMIRAQRWCQYYDCSIDTAPPFSEAYFVVLFSALPVLSLESLPFANTGMGRELLAMTVEVAPGYSLVVGTSHLESLPQFKRERVSQLKQSLTFLSDRATAIGGGGGNQCLGAVLMGDTNLIRGDMKLLDPRCTDSREITVEEAKSARSKCRKCGETIDKGAVRVGKTAKDTLPNGRVVEMTLWFHKPCFLFHNGMTQDEKQVVIEYGVRHQHQRHQGEGGETKQAEQQQAEDVVDPSTLGLPPLWKDLWLSVDGNTEANGFTYDGKRNTVIQNKSYQSRLDRVYFYPGPPVQRTTASHAFETIQMVGTEPIADGLWPSDHFGLLSTFAFDPFIGNNVRTEAKRKRDDDDDANGSSRTERKAQAPAEEREGSKTAPIELE